MIDASYRVCNCLGHADSNPAIPKTLYRFSPALTRKGYASFHPGSIARFETQAKSFMTKYQAGRRNGRLVLVRRVAMENGKAGWECKCDCGNTKIVSLKHVGVSPIRSCGCLAIDNRHDLKGRMFGRLRAIEYVKSSWRCMCNCGNEVTVPTSKLLIGETRSCGCLRRDVSRERKTTHGMHEAPEYGIWLGIKARCSNPKYKQWHDYGGRGISVCQEWLDNFDSFYRHLGPRPSSKHQIDRIDNNGNYEPGNVRWATAEVQRNNTRANRMITANGRTQSLTLWAFELGISVGSLADRIDRSGWTPERAVTTPRLAHRHDHRSPLFKPAPSL